MSLTLPAARLNLIALSAEELRLYRDYPEALASGRLGWHGSTQTCQNRCSAVRIKLERMALYCRWSSTPGRPTG